ncbi:MAG: tRNA pseudouridine(38-40) synthase TruA [Candidatus Gastranaerophilales bacterium]|nr:tRNA pseudouridine(38-40) synthase TruA [Candidatus Gastranaerophilales bacterium]
MQRYVLSLEYLGTDFSGSQKQKTKVRTVQGELEKALGTLTKQNIRTIFSGRTDAGVHARGQIVHFDTEVEADLTESKFLYSVNGLLPKDMSVAWIKKAEKTFHAQKSATARFYRYKIISREQRSAFDRNCFYTREKIDIDYINQALGFLIGEHDFSSFKKSGSANPAKICTIYTAKCHRQNDEILIDIVANRFLYGMVRAIVGTILYLERKSLSPESLKDILENRNRAKAGPAASPDGLTLMKVIYDKNTNMEMAYENILSETSRS